VRHVRTRQTNQQRAAAAYEAARESLGLVTDAELRAQLELEIDIAYAESLFRQREYARAVEEIRAILADLDPSATELQRQVRLRLVDGLLALGDRPAIEAELAAFERDFPGDERGQLQYAQFLMQGSSEDMARAQQVLSKILSQNSDHALARYMRGSVYFSQGEYEAARNDLRAAKDLEPAGFNFRHRVRLASLYDTLGEDTLAVTELQQILAEDSANPPVVDLLVNMYLKQGRRGDANQLLGNYRAAQPDNPYWPGRMAELSLANEQFAAAARYAEEAYNESGRRADSYLFNWMRALLLDGRPTRVVEIFDGLPTAQQGPLIRLAAARAYRETNAPEAARTQIRAALEQASGISINQVQRVAERSGEVVGAQDLLEVYDEILADPPEAIANNLAAMVRLQVGKAERLLVLQRAQEAYDFVSAALESIPEESRRSEEYVAGLLVKAQSAEAARLDFDTVVKPVYESVLEIDPENVIALNNLAFLLAKQGDHVEALPYAQKLRSLEVPQPAIYDTVGVVLMKNGELAEAQDAFRRALGLNQSFIDANYHLAELFLRYHERPKMVAGREFANKTIELAKSWLNRNSAAPEERKAQMREWIERAETLLQQRT